ncbi:MAG: hypothetical protein WCQ03_12105, partial [Phycisphaerae bacterium]
MSAGDIKAGGAYVELSVDSTKLNSGFKSAESATMNVVSKIKGIGDALQSVGVKFAAFGAAMSAPAIAGIKAFSDYGDIIDKVSKRTGLKSSFVGSLKYAADQFDVPIQAVAKGVSKMERGVATGSKGTVDALEGIGIALSDIQGVSADERFLKVAEALSNVGDEASRAASAQEIFGNAGIQMLPFLQGGADEMRRLSTEARLVGAVLGDEAAEKAGLLDDAMKRAEKSIEGVRLAIGQGLYPLFKPMLDRFIDVSIHVGNMIRQNPEWAQSWAKVAVSVGALGTAMVALAGVIVAVTSPALVATAAIMAVAGAVAAVSDLT